MEDNVTVIYKDIKYANIKVRPSLEVVITVPFGTESGKIDSILDKRRSWIKKQLTYFNDRQHHIKEYVSGESTQFLGKNYRLKIMHSNEEKVKLSGGYLNVWVKIVTDSHSKKRLVDEWLKDKAKFHFSKLLDKYSKIVGVSIDKFSIRCMKTRWGSCNPKKSYININIELIKKSLDLIEYVVLHELTHLVHYNHTVEFYDFMTLHMPNWKIRKNKLENT